MIDIGAATADLVATLQAAGVSTSMDLRDLNVPGVYVLSPDVAYRNGHTADATWKIVTAVPNTGRSAALANLGVLIAVCNRALGERVVAARPVDLATLDGAGPLPAYELTFTTRLVQT